MEIKDTSISEQNPLAVENARLRGDLLAIGSRVCHDLRSPLGSILNTIELLREMTGEKEPANAALFKSLFGSVEEMIKLIKNVSLVTKATANPAAKKRIKMGDIVSGVLQRLERQILKKGAAVSAPENWPEMDGVAEWLEFAWWNLLKNALQYGGQKIQLGWVREKNEFRFWISDNGNGVASELRPKIFQTFDSLHTPSSTRGLGLSIVRRLTELQGGRCGHEFDAKGEITFYFTLPLVKNGA